jgi:hypothetical protein
LEFKELFRIRLALVPSIKSIQEIAKPNTPFIVGSDFDFVNDRIDFE